MKDFLAYFFGVGTETEFINFSLAHFLPILVAVGVIFCIYRFRCYQFWIEHTLGYVAIFQMIFVHKMRPTVKSAIKPYAALYFLAYLPWLLMDRKAKKARAQTPSAV